MTTVELKSNEGVRQFDIEHAQALLTYQLTHGLLDWTLSDKKFTFDNGVLKSRGNSKANQESEEQNGDS